MTRNPLLSLKSYGQSIWLDELDRGRICSGALRRYFEEDGLSGVTANPSTSRRRSLKVAESTMRPFVSWHFKGGV